MDDIILCFRALSHALQLCTLHYAAWYRIGQGLYVFKYDTVHVKSQQWSLPNKDTCSSKQSLYKGHTLRSSNNSSLLIILIHFAPPKEGNFLTKNKWSWMSQGSFIWRLIIVLLTNEWKCLLTCLELIDSQLHSELYSSPLKSPILQISL